MTTKSSAMRLHFFAIESVKYPDLQGEGLFTPENNESDNTKVHVPSFVFDFEEVNEDIIIDLYFLI